MKKILCGKIVKPQGIKGEVKVQTYVDNPQDFCNLEFVIIKDKQVPIIKARVHNEFAFLLLEGYVDRDAAESLRNVEVFLDIKTAQSLKKGDYFIEEIVGLDAYVDHTYLGKVVDVLQNTGADVFVVEGKRKYMIPFINKAVKELDMEKRRIVYDSKVFEEIVYEY